MISRLARARISVNKITLLIYSFRVHLIYSFVIGLIDVPNYVGNNGASRQITCLKMSSSNDYRVIDTTT